MPLILRLFRSMLCSITDTNHIGPCGKRSFSFFSILLLAVAALSGCATENLDEVRAAQPIRTATFDTPYDTLAACVKQRVERDLWIFGEPSVHWKREKDRSLIRVYALYARTTLFDVAFEQTHSDRTSVEYRQGIDGYGIRDQTWGIIVSCNQQGLTSQSK